MTSTIELMELRERWAMIAADLMRVRATLPSTAAGDAIGWFQEYVDHNELELACDMLELYANEHGADRRFWRCLTEAAKKVELPSHIELYEDRAKNAKDSSRSQPMRIPVFLCG